MPQVSSTVIWHNDFCAIGFMAELLSAVNSYALAKRYRRAQGKTAATFAAEAVLKIVDDIVAGEKVTLEAQQQATHLFKQNPSRRYRYSKPDDNAHVRHITETIAKAILGKGSYGVTIARGELALTEAVAAVAARARKMISGSRILNAEMQWRACDAYGSLRIDEESRLAFEAIWLTGNHAQAYALFNKPVRTAPIITYDYP